MPLQGSPSNFKGGRGYPQRKGGWGWQWQETVRKAGDNAKPLLSKEEQRRGPLKKEERLWSPLRKERHGRDPLREDDFRKEVAPGSSPGRTMLGPPQERELTPGSPQERRTTLGSA